MDETGLSTTSCVYEVGPGDSFNEVVEALGSLVIQTDRLKQRLDLRVGIIFKRRGEALRKLYFQGSDGSHDIKGFSDDRELIAKAGLPERLRAIAKHQDVSLVLSGHDACPHA
jgi:hypothetical protein